MLVKVVVFYPISNPGKTEEYDIGETSYRIKCGLCKSKTWIMARKNKHFVAGKECASFSNLKTFR
jgi:hypothetical protein